MEEKKRKEKVRRIKKRKVRNGLIPCPRHGTVFSAKQSLFTANAKYYFLNQDPFLCHYS